MEAVLRKWGNSPALRLPLALLRQADMTPDQKVDLSVADGCIVIQPSKVVSYELDALLKGVTRSNRHTEVDTGAPVGREVW